MRRLRRERIGLVTTEWVLAEVVTLLKARGHVQSALDLGTALQTGQLGEVIQSTPELRNSAWKMFVGFRDLSVGWVDCASFAAMNELGIRNFFGFDDDFVRAGFVEFG